MPRPSIQTPEMIEEICSRLAEGEPLAQICRSEGMPGLRTVYDWTEAQPDISARIARARDAGEDVIAADCLRIADTPQEGIETVTKGESIETRTGDMLGHRKLQIDTRLKLLAKWNPKKYGDRISQEVTGKDGKDLIPTAPTLADFYATVSRIPLPGDPQPDSDVKDGSDPQPDSDV